MLRFVVTARPTGPIADSSTTYIAHSASAISLAPVVPFLDQALADGQTMALDGGAPVGANADLRKARDLLRKRLCFGAGSPLRGHVFAQANGHALLGRHFASRQDNLERAALSD